MLLISPMVWWSGSCVGGSCSSTGVLGRRRDLEGGLSMSWKMTLRSRADTEEKLSVPVLLVSHSSPSLSIPNRIAWEADTLAKLPPLAAEFLVKRRQAVAGFYWEGGVARDGVVGSLLII